MVSIKEIIYTDIATRGTGTKMSPVRSIIQIFEKDGTLIAEKDDWFGDRFVQGDLVNFARWCISSGNTAPAYSDVEKWLEEIEDKK